MSILVCPFGDWQEIFVCSGRDLTHLQYPLPWEGAQPLSSSQPRRISPGFQILCRAVWPFIMLPPTTLKFHTREPGRITRCSGKGKKYSTFPLPKGNQKLHLFSQDTPTSGLQGTRRDFSSKDLGDDNFQHDRNCDCRNDCSAVQKRFNCLG